MTDAWRKRPWSKTVSNLPTLGPKRPFTWAERYSTSSASAPLISANCLGESSYYLADNDLINICHEKLVCIYLAVLPSMSLESSEAPAVTSSLQIARSLQRETMRIIWIFQVGFTCKPPPYGERCGLSHCPLYQLETRMRKGSNI